MQLKAAKAVGADIMSSFPEKSAALMYLGVNPEKTRYWLYDMK